MGDITWLIKLPTYVSCYYTYNMEVNYVRGKWSVNSLCANFMIREVDLHPP